LDLVIISTSDRWTQAEEQIRTTATGLREAGHSVRLVAHADSLLAEKFNAHGFEVEVIQGWDCGPSALWRMRRYLKQTAPDVVHFADPRALTCGGMAVYGLKIPARVYSYRLGNPACSPVSARMFSDVIVCNAQSAVAKLVQQGIPWPSVHLVRDAVELSRATRMRWSNPRVIRSCRSGPRLLTVAPMTDPGGWQKTLAALSLVRRRYADVGIRVLAGDMDIQELQKAAADHGHVGHIEMHRGKHLLADLLPKSDLFVIPDRIMQHWDLLGEVMLSGTPMVTVPDDLTREWLGPWAGGKPVAWFSEVTGADSFGRAILQALADPDECRLRARGGCHRVTNDFPGDRMVAELLQIYLDHLAGPTQLSRAA
jgi:glycosyltransferase involved in cell wall biosynthesis